MFIKGLNSYVILYGGQRYYYLWEIENMFGYQRQHMFLINYQYGDSNIKNNIKIKFTEL